LAIALLGLMAASALAGLLLRGVVHPALSRTLLIIGTAALLAGCLFGIAPTGRNPFGLVTGGLLPILLLALAVH
jgi:hypothetical protein